MSLLETRNKKFKRPVVIIIGVFFLIVLTYFAKYIESLPEQGTVSEKNVTKIVILVQLDENESLYVDNKKVAVENLAKILKSMCKKEKNARIQFQTTNLVSETALKIIEIFQKNNYEVVMEVSSK